MPYGLFHPGFSTSELFLLCTIEDSNFLGSALGNRNVSGTDVLDYKALQSITYTVFD